MSSTRRQSRRWDVPDQNLPSQPPGQNFPLKPPPENLPVKEVSAQAIFPSPVVPRPTSPAPALPSNQPQTVSPPSAPTGQPPVAPKASPPTGAVQPPPLMKSTIRTMEDDLALLKKAQIGPGPTSSSPSQLKPPAPPAPRVEPSSPVPPAPLTPVPKFVPPVPPPPLPAPSRPNIFPKIELDKLAKIPVTIPHPFPEKSPEEIGLNVPPPRRFSLRSPTTLIITLAVLAAAGFSVWFFLFYKVSTPGVGISPTPIVTLTPAATPSPPLETVFTKTNAVTIGLTENFFTTFEEPANAVSIGLGETWLYKINKPENGRRYGLDDFSSGAAIQAPADLLSAVDDQEFYLTLMRKTDDKLSYGFVVKVLDRGGANSALRNWEVTMANNLKKLFGFDVAKAASPAFLDNPVSYPNVTIRYRNFPRPDQTIDYAIVPAPNGESYLVFANSREHIFNIIDKIFTISANPSR